MKVDDNVS